jgi:hypothetical protein
LRQRSVNGSRAAFVILSVPFVILSVPLCHPELVEGCATISSHATGRKDVAATAFEFTHYNNVTGIEKRLASACRLLTHLL